MNTVNSLKQGSLVMDLNKNEDVKMDDGSILSSMVPQSRLIGGTQDGALMCFISFHNSHFKFLKEFQDEVEKMQLTVGNLE